jgi:hypothetical protein
MNKVIYQLTVEDVQNVAEQELGHKLSAREVELIQDLVAKKISWYDAIAESIDELNRESRKSDTAT